MRSLQIDIIVLSLLFASVSTVIANDNNLSYRKLLKLRGSIAQCRASCFDKFVFFPATRGYPIKFNYGGTGILDANNLGCTSETNWKCSMCWDYCENLAVFEPTRDQMCADDICLEGCQHACKFMRETSTPTLRITLAPSSKIVSSSAMPTSLEKAPELKLVGPKLTKTGVVISWTLSRAKLTYAVFGLTSTRHSATAAWEEIQQTTGHQVLLPLDAKYDEIVVAAFNSNGMLQHDRKKLVFQLRAKRSLLSETTVSKLSEDIPAFTTYFTTINIIVCIVTMLIVCLVIAIKCVRSSSKSAEVHETWV